MTLLLTPNTMTTASLADDLAREFLRVADADTAYVYLPNGDQVTGFVVRAERMSDGSTVNNVHLLTNDRLPALAPLVEAAREAQALNAPLPVILPVEEYGQGKTASIKGLNDREVAARIGFISNQKDDPGKVKHSWGFTVDGVRCAVWDYKGSHLQGRWSAWGPMDALRKVFGEHVTEGAFS